MDTRFLSPFFQFSTSHSYSPRYNIVRTKTGYTIQVAVPGYSRDQLEVNFSQGKLWVRSLDNLKFRENENDIFIEKGLSEKRFTLEFSVSAELTPKNVTLDKGILQLQFEKVDSQDSVLEITEGA